ncbi:MAG: triose-phosphate isomerase [Bacteroidota bacterium]|nr:triose-phosphate isomerase [Bacteroidota bacterium]
MRKNILVANWKMNLTRNQEISIVENVLPNISSQITEVVFAPNYLSLYKIGKMCNNYENVKVAAQNCSKTEKGAFTGEVSAEMIASCSADYVIIGHSERRTYFNESNTELAEKVNRALENNLSVIFCCGESISQREGGGHFDWIKQQLSESIFHFSVEKMEKIVIAYEPIWAIGTGKTASTVQAQEMHAFIRDLLNEKYGDSIAESTSILYGGSCSSTDAKDLFAQQDIDGGLIGGASLNANDFLAIINSF